MAHMLCNGVTIKDLEDIMEMVRGLDWERTHGNLSLYHAICHHVDFIINELKDMDVKLDHIKSAAMDEGDWK